MNNEQDKKRERNTLIAMIALVVILFVGVKLIFAGLEQVLPDQWSAQVWEDMQTEKGGLALYDLRMISSEELEAEVSEDVRSWLEESAAGEAGAYWLCRRDTDEYVLYLPAQDRAISLTDITATEETDPDGETALVLRIRTPEEGDTVVPQEQLFCIKTESESWRGIRLRVILDGREQKVAKLVSQEGRLYSTEEVYIGRF